MGASQSTDKKVYFIRKSDGKFEQITAETLRRELLTEAEMSEKHHRLLADGLIMPCTIYTEPNEMAMVSEKYFKSRGPITGIMIKTIQTHWNTDVLAGIANIISSSIEVKLSANEIMKIANEIVCAVAKHCFELFPPTEISRDDIAKVIENVPNIAAITAVKSNVIDFMFNSVIKAQKTVRGGATVADDSNIVFMQGAYEKLNKISGGDPAGMSAPLALDLSRLSAKKKEFAEALLNVFTTSPYEQFQKIAGSSTEEKLRAIADYLRKNPVKNGDSIVNTFTKSINNVFGVTVIDPLLPVDARVSQMEDLLNAMSHGVTTDFYLTGIDIYNDVRNLIRIKAALRICINAIKERYERSGSTVEAHSILQALEAVYAEFDRYITLMSMTLNREFQPTLAGILAKGEYDKPRTRTVVERIGNILQGITSTASQAVAVSAALEKLGMTVDEYKELKSKQEFWARFVELTDPKNVKSDTEFSELMNATEIILKSLSHAPEIAQAIKGGAMPRLPPKQILDRLTFNQKRANVIVNAYGIAIQSGLNRIRVAVDNFAGAIGKEIPLGTSLDNFVDLLRQLTAVQIDTNQVHLALLGYYKDAAAKEVRDRTIGTLKSVEEYANMITKDAAFAGAHAYFDAIAKAIHDLLTAIDQSADNIREVTGGDASGAGLESESMLDIRKLIVRDKLRLIDSIDKADYMMRVAQIRSNLKDATLSFANDTKTYDENVLAPAVASRMNKLRTQRQTILKKLSDKYVKPDPDDAFDIDDAPFKRPNHDGLTRADTTTKDFIGQYYDRVIDFWDTAQAIELYLKYFTSAVISNTEAIGDITMLIREVEVLVKTYDQNAGDSIARIFEENFAGSNKVTKGVDDCNVRAKTTSTPFHQWEDLGGLPFTPVVKDKLKSLIKETADNIKKYSALKNLVSFFIHFGSQIGGNELKRISRRTPVEIYNGLINYLSVSTFAFGFKTGKNIVYNDDNGSLSIGAHDENYIDDNKSARIACGFKGTEVSKSVIMRPAPSNSDIYDEATGLDLKIENQVFSGIIKALASKVLILSGMADLLSRPYGTQPSRTSIRVVIGAAPDEMPKVDDAATELYARLVLLALFYKSRFDYTKVKESTKLDSKDVKIAILPDIAGSVFSEFINLIFKKFPRVETQFFTDNEIKQLIAEINVIHSKLASKYPSDTCRSILREFVRTMSQMVYIISPDDHKKYTEITEYAKSSKEGFTELAEVDILGDEGLIDEMIKQPMPADSYTEHAMLQGKIKEGNQPKFEVDPAHWEIVRKFRCYLERMLAEPSRFTLRNSITATQVKLGQTTNSVDRFKLICGLIRGTGGSTTIENARKMIFIEVLGTSLNMLSGIYTTIKSFQIASIVSNPLFIARLFDSDMKTATTDVNKTIAALSQIIATVLHIEKDAAAVKVVQDLLKKTTKEDSGQITSMNSETNELSHQFTFDPANGVKFGTTVIPQKETAKIAAHCLHYPSALALLLESVATVMGTTHGFVRADISDRKLLVSFAAVEEYVKKFIASLVSFVDVMRPHIEPDLVKRFTDKEYVGSLYWLQEQFVEKLIEGRFASYGKQNYRTLSELSDTIREAFECLTSQIKYDANGGEIAPFFVNYVPALANIIAYNSVDDLFGQHGDDTFRCANIVSDPFDSLLVRGTAKEKTIDTRFLCSLAMNTEEQIYGDINNSILFSFNKLLMMFLRQVYDTSTGKIFTGLIDNFAQGAFNNAIMSERNTYPDHLPKYWIETGQARNVYNVATLEKGGFNNWTSEAGKYLKYLNDYARGDTSYLGFNSGGIVSGANIKTPNGVSMHKFMANVMLAWFATHSDIIDPQTLTVYGGETSAGEFADFDNPLFGNVGKKGELTDTTEVIRILRLFRAGIEEFPNNDWSKKVNDTTSDMDVKKEIQKITGNNTDTIPNITVQRMRDGRDNLPAFIYALALRINDGSVKKHDDAKRMAKQGIVIELLITENITKDSITYKIARSLTHLMIQQQTIYDALLFNGDYGIATFYDNTTRRYGNYNPITTDDINNMIGYFHVLGASRWFTYGSIIPSSYYVGMPIIAYQLLDADNSELKPYKLFFNSAKQGIYYPRIAQQLSTILDPSDYTNNPLMSLICHDDRGINISSSQIIARGRTLNYEIARRLKTTNVFKMLHDVTGCAAVRSALNVSMGTYGPIYAALITPELRPNTRFHDAYSYMAQINSRHTYSLSPCRWDSRKNTDEDAAKQAMINVTMLDENTIDFACKGVSHAFCGFMNDVFKGETNALTACRGYFPNISEGLMKKLIKNARDKSDHLFEFDITNRDEQTKWAVAFVDHLLYGGLTFDASYEESDIETYKYLYNLSDGGKLIYIDGCDVDKDMTDLDVHPGFDQKDAKQIIRAIGAARDLFLQLSMIEVLYRVKDVIPADIDNTYLQTIIGLAGRDDVFAAMGKESQTNHPDALLIFNPAKVNESNTINQGVANGIFNALLSKYASNPEQLLSMSSNIWTRPDTVQLIAAGTTSDEIIRKIDRDYPSPQNPVVETDYKALSNEKIRHVISLQEYQQAITDEKNPTGSATFIVYPGSMDKTGFFDAVSKYHLRIHNTSQTPLSPDDYPSATKFGARQIPDGEHVLFASIGYRLHNILTSTDERTNLRTHLIESAADIPSYFRDKYRAILPMFRACFHTLVQKCDFYRRVMEQTSNPCFLQTAKDSANDTVYGHSKDLAKVGYGFSGNVSDKLLGILRKITTGASAVVTDCSQTLKAIGDQPRYFEVSNGSIDAYRSQNNGDPIMPLSALLRVMLTEDPANQPGDTHRGNCVRLEQSLMPRYGFGESGFKYQYAIRGLYHQLKAETSGKAALDPLQSLAALESMVNIFNKFSHGTIKIDATLAQNLAQSLTTGFDFLHDVHRVKRYTSVANWRNLITNASDEGVIMQQSIFTAGARQPSNALQNHAMFILSTEPSQEVPTPFAINKESVRNVSNVIAIVENNNRDDAIRNVIDGTLPESERGDAIMANIVDMNIIPFDIHVLARQVPLHFIWNHAYTFDAIVGEMIYEQTAPQRILELYECPDQTMEIKTARDALFAMLTDPYRSLKRNEKYMVDRMLIGATGVPGLNRVKFISDQLAGGILFGNLITPHNVHREIGPQDSDYGYEITYNRVDKQPMTPEEIEMCKFIAEYLRETKEKEMAPALQHDIFTLWGILHVIRPWQVRGEEHIISAVARLLHLAGVLSSAPDSDVFKCAKAVRNDPNVMTIANRINAQSATSQILLAMIDKVTLTGIDADALRSVIKRWKYATVPSESTIIVSSNPVTFEIKHIPGRIVEDKLSYGSTLDEYGNVAYSSAPMSEALAKFAPVIHDMRMDTLLVRNLIHISLVFAVMQNRLRGDTVYLRDRQVASAMSSLNPSITQFNGFQSIAQEPYAAQKPTYVTKKYI